MASITVNTSSDLNVLNITYNLNANETFVDIKVHPFTDEGLGSGFQVLVPEQTVHGGGDTARTSTGGTYSTNVVEQSFLNAGASFGGINVISITTTPADKPDVETISSANILLGKTLDCCIAEKMVTAVDCNCDDDKCNESLFDAQKMFLFKQSAEYVLKNIGQGVALDDIKRLAALNDAKSKYQKAIELCTSGCGCNNSPS
jgi:hypothetical protein